MTTFAATIAQTDAEAAFLGCLLLASPAQVLELVQGVEVEDFTDPRHRVILGVTVQLSVEGTSPDPVTALGALRRCGAVASFTVDTDAGVYLAYLLEQATVAANAQAYRRIVIEHRARRRVTEAAERLTQAAGRSALVDVRALLETELDDVRRQLDRACAA